MSGLARFDLGQVGELVLARLSGEVDLSNATALRNELTRAVPNEAAGLVLDLSGTSYLDSAGIRLVFGLAESLRMRNQELRVIVPESSPLRRILDLAEVEQVAPIVDSVRAALDS